MSVVRQTRVISSVFAASLVVLVGSSVVATRAQAPAEVTTEAAVDIAANTAQAQRFAKLEAALTGVTLVGHFTETGKDTIDPKTERYELGTVKHVGDGRWLIEARITYGENDVTVPLTLPIKWAGDTPVITVDNMGIPGLGFYTARVMIYANHYAGFWSGGDHGGHLFGVIERPGVNDEVPNDE